MKYLPLFAELKDQSILVAGGGEAAARKIRLLLRAQARPTVFAAAANDEIVELEKAGKIDLRRRPIDGADLAGCTLLVIALEDDHRAEAIAKIARAAGVLVNVVDRPGLSNVVMPAIVDRDPVLVAIGSSGTAPVLVRRLRERLEALLPARLGALAAFAGRYRQAAAAAIEEPRKRMKFWQGFFDGPIARAVLAGREGEAGEAMLRLVNLGKSEAETGTVTLVGVGPGDPDLLTLRALRALQDADVVLHDALVGERIMDYVRRDARRIDVGKRKGRHSHSQDAINHLLLTEARKGNRVARLKGGDPFIFGRGGEEMVFLRGHGVTVDIVPGITAAIAAGAAAGIPLTLRGVASAVTFVAGHGQDSLPDLDWRALTSGAQTVALYMGVSTVGEVCEQLIGHGLAPAMPVAVIENATLPAQRILHARLGQLAQTCARENVRAPALILIGEVVGLAQAGEVCGQPALAAAN